MPAFGLTRAVCDEQFSPNLSLPTRAQHMGVFLDRPFGSRGNHRDTLRAPPCFDVFAI